MQASREAREAADIAKDLTKPEQDDPWIVCPTARRRRCQPSASW
jgi:hypothetical protein